MGKISKIIHEELVSPAPDRNSNLLRVYEMENGEVVIHFRNLKILLLKEEIPEAVMGFTIALDNFNKNNYLLNDL